MSSDSERSSRSPNHTRDYALSVADGAVRLLLGLVAMLIVEYRYGKEGLGQFAFLLAVFVLGAYLSAFGIPTRVERTLPFISSDARRRTALLRDSLAGVIVLGLAAALIIVLFSLRGTDRAHVELGAAAWLFIAAAIPLHNTNQLKLSTLHGLEDHETPARLQMKARVLFLVSVVAFCLFRVPAPWLALSLLLPEVALFGWLRPVRLPSVSSSLGSLKRLGETLRESQKTLFTDDALEVALYIDFFVLGLMVSAVEEGVYAKASILARLFLVVPLGFHVVFRERYCTLAARGAVSTMARLFKSSAGWFFFGHAVLLIIFVLWYPGILAGLFPDASDVGQSLAIFQTLAVGLLFFSTVAASEPLYEAQTKLNELRRLTLAVFALNLVLNVQLIPYARAQGAAAATTISLLVYFALFGLGLKRELRLDKLKYLYGGAAAFLVWFVFHKWSGPTGATLVGVPLLTAALFWLVGLLERPPALEDVKTHTVH